MNTSKKTHTTTDSARAYGKQETSLPRAHETAQTCQFFETVAGIDGVFRLLDVTYNDAQHQTI
jgi:hypothetical protein